MPLILAALRTQSLRSTSVTAPWLGRVVGAVRLSAPAVELDRGYECAAWWEERRSVTGVFPLYLRKGHAYPHELYLEALVPAEVVDDYFPALFGGVSVSTKPYEPRHVGEKRTMRLRISVLDAVADTGNSPSAARDLFVDPAFWPVLLAEAEANLASSYADMPRWWEALQEGEDEFRSRVSMVAHAAELVASAARVACEVGRAIDSYEKDMRSSYGRETWERNCAWVFAARIAEAA